MSPIKLLCSCGALVDTKPCPKCKRQDNRRRRAKSQAHGLDSPYWQWLRRGVLIRDNYRCQLHLDRHCTGTATTVHIDPALEGNHRRARRSDCISACAHCHGVVDGTRARGEA